MSDRRYQDRNRDLYNDEEKFNIMMELYEAKKMQEKEKKREANLKYICLLAVGMIISLIFAFVGVGTGDVEFSIGWLIMLVIQLVSIIFLYKGN